MIYSNFINKTSKYLKSVRILKNYVSFDMVFPNSWVVSKKTPEGVEVIETENQEGNVIKSFVSENKKELIDKIENIIDGIIKTNIEREEKEKLFKSKVNELKNIFEKEKLENLKGLKFDLEELTKFIQNEEAEVSSRVTEGTELTK
jgi:hypothetical protein